MSIYQVIICPQEKNKLNHRICLNSTACGLCICNKYINMIDSENENISDRIILQALTITISTKCTLNCKYCGQELYNYPSEKRINFSLEHIKSDFDAFMEAVDVVGMISIIGGEPFVHPDLPEIVNHCLQKKNFGVVNITTNGICVITEDLLKKINNDRVKISFSNYTKFLNENQNRVFDKNVELVKNSGMSYGVSVPLWNLFGEIKKFNHSDGELKAAKHKCENRRICSSIVDGRYMPCRIVENASGLNKFECVNDYVDLRDKKNLRERIRACLDKSYYEACRYCSFHIETMQIPSGEQVNKKINDDER